MRARSKAALVAPALTAGGAVAVGPSTADASGKGLPAVPRFDVTAQRVVGFNPGGPQIVADMAADHQCSFWDAQSS
ncbi:hypothetical protein [Nonomuraea basaltis]|uniref:hypothetical protein n=1 Tax=Nonomuraea basaltis TaxID=2495887 RepID=UPI00110C6FA0|nr:hypothetical protein [Nonomuraea basaltis]TMR94070.1 hypothetical protein EJK15_36040 [Nonomuraea basaltis]